MSNQQINSIQPPPDIYSYPFAVPRGDVIAGDPEKYVAWFQQEILPRVTELSLSNKNLTMFETYVVPQKFIDSATQTLESAHWIVIVTKIIHSNLHGWLVSKQPRIDVSIKV